MYIGSSRPSANDYRSMQSMNDALDLINTNMVRLSTMKRINRGADDPAGMIAMEKLNSEMRAIQKSQDNASRAAGYARVADSGMSQANSLMTDIRGLIVEASNTGVTSDAQRDAIQMQIDASVEALNRIGKNTSYGGNKLLDGSAGFEIDGVQADQIADIQVHQNRGGGSNDLDIEIIQAARPAELDMGEISTAIDFSFELTGNDGSVAINVQKGMSLGEVADQINGQTPQTGVSAMVINGRLTLTGNGVGRDSYVEINPITGSPGGFGLARERIVGTDIMSQINGQIFTGYGNTVQLNSGGIQADITFVQGFEGAVEPITVTGDASRFSFSPNLANYDQLGLPQVSSTALGGSAGRLSQITSGGPFDLRSGNFRQAAEIVQESQSTLLDYQARTGAFEKYTIDTSFNMLGTMEESIAGALSFYDTNVAEATSNLARGNIMLQAALESSMINNYNRQAAIGLLNTTDSFDAWGSYW